MKTVTIALVVTLLGFPNTGLSTETKAVSPYRAESSAYIVQGKDAWTYVTENRSFRFAEVLDDRGNYEAPYFQKKPIAMNTLTAGRAYEEMPRYRLGRSSAAASVKCGGH